MRGQGRQRRRFRFRVVLIEHGYATTRHEREIIESAGGELVDADHLPLPAALELCRQADGILCRRAQLTAGIIEQFQRCRGIVRYGVGTDNIDVQAATRAGIMVGHVPGYCVDEVSTHAIGLMLAGARRLVETDRKMRRGGWDLHRTDLIYRFAGKTVGLVGLGQIGSAVARKLQGWEVRVLAADPFVSKRFAAECGARLIPLRELLRSSDFVSLHLPLRSETRHMINSRTLGWMKRGAWLINTARGPVVETRALLKSLNQGRLAGAALDVFEEEPLPDRHPLRRHPRVILSDHTAWYSEESQVDLQKIAAREIANICLGKLPGSLANPEVIKVLGRWKEWKPAENMKWQLAVAKRPHK